MSDTTLPRELEVQLAALRRQPGFQAACDALRAADENGDRRLSYQEYRNADLPEGWRQRLSALETEIIHDYRSGDFGNLLQITLRNDLGGVNRVLQREGIPAIGMNFVQGVLRTHPR